MPTNEFLKGRLMSVSYDDDGTNYKLFGLGTKLRTFSMAHNNEAIYGVGDTDRTPTTIKALQFSGEFEVETYVLISRFPDVIQFIKGDSNALPIPMNIKVYEASSFDNVTSIVTNWNVIELNDVFVKEVAFNVREGELVELRIRGFYRHLTYETSTTAPTELSETEVFAPVGFYGATISGLGQSGVVRGFSLTLDSGLDPINILGDRRFGGVSPGTISIKGSATVIPTLNDSSLSSGILANAYNTLGNVNKPLPKGYDGSYKLTVVFKDGFSSGSTKTITVSGVVIDNMEITGEPEDFVVYSVDFIGSDISIV